MAKRLFDLVCALLGLLLLAPLLLTVAIWIKLDSPGPVIFRQQRVGRFGVPFRIHKFRTMTHVLGQVPHGPLITVGEDVRITRAGHWLRRHKLDELPQLIDVLTGHMSLVGPRPEVPRYVALYPDSMRNRVLAVRPGITDPASLAFRGESAQLAAAADPEREYVEIIMPRKLALAADYADNANLLTDLGLVLQTLRVLWTR